MAQRFRVAFRSLAILCLMWLPVRVSAQAQDPAPPQIPPVREHVEVVATRLPETPDDVPVAVEVIGGDELRNRGVTDLRGALALATGVDIAPGGDNGPASAVPEFWGLKEFDAFLLVVDDVPWGGAFSPALSTLDLHDVDRIEVLRGPAPVMFGATSFVGVIHVVHKSAATAPPALSARIGSFGSGGGSASFSFPMRGWQGRVTVDADRQGFSDARTSFRRGHVRWHGARSSTDGRIWFAVDGMFLDQDPASPHPRAGRGLSSLVPLDANHNPAGAFLNDRRVGTWFGIDHTRGARTWTTTASISRGSHDILRGFLQEVSEGGPNARGLRERIDLTDLYADSHVAWSRANGVRVIVGVDFLHGQGNAKGADFDYHVPLDGSMVVPVTAPSTLDVRIGDRRDLAGGYVSTEWTPTARIRIDAGARLNVTTEERDNREGGDAALDEGRGDRGSQHNVRPSGSLGAIWTTWTQGVDHVRLFANYRNTFKPAAVDFGIGDEGEGPLKPETSQSYEAGLKARVAQGRIGLEATMFRMDFANLVIARTINGLPSLTNAGTERFRGVEVGAAWFLPHDLTGRASYSFHDARFRDYVAEFDGVPTQLAGKRLEMSPRHLASAGMVWAPTSGLLALGELNFSGGRFLNKRNTALADGYVTLTAALGYRMRGWEVRISGHNLTDQRPPVSESELGEAQFYRLPARRVDAALSVRFGH